MRSLGEVQYSTGIPQYYYNTIVSVKKQRTELGGLGQFESIFAPTGDKGTGASGVQQASGFIGTIGNVATSIIGAFNAKSMEKNRLKSEQKIAELNAKFAFMTEKERIAANIEIQRIKADMTLLTQQESSRFGIGMTKVLALAGVGSIGLIGMFAVLAKIGD